VDRDEELQRREVEPSQEVFQCHRKEARPASRPEPTPCEEAKG
jgi:hypothetical protein